MSKYLPFLFIFLVVACSTETSKDIPQESQETEINGEEKDTIIDVSIDTTQVIETEKPNTDLSRMGIKESVQSMSIVINQAEENGEPFGMDGSYTEIEFNELGNIVLEKEVGCCGMEDTYYFHEYTDDQLLLRKYTFYQNSAPTPASLDSFDLKEKYFYNTDNQLSKFKQVDSDTVLLVDHVFKYNEDGSIKKEEISYPKENTIETIKYDYQPGKTTKTFFVNEELDYTTILHLDSIKRVYKEEMINEEFHLVMHYTYEDDEKGNWILQKEESYYLSEPDFKQYLRTERSFIYK